MATSDVTVTRAPYPSGAASGRRSIEEVARLAKKGRDHKVVLAFTAHTLRAAGKPTTPLGRARALHEAIQKKLVYFPDPDGQERMVEAQVTLSDFMPGDDCDSHVIAFLACCMACGIRCVSVGHGYDRTYAIWHVLGAIWDNGRWYYADETPYNGIYLPFGQVPVKPTWEYVIDTNTLGILCDANACLAAHGNVKPGLITDPSHFLGVAGPPPMADPNAPATVTPVAVNAAWSAHLSAINASLAADRDRALLAYRRLRQVAADQNLSFPDPPVTETPTSTKRVGWSQSDDQAVAQAMMGVDVFTRAMADAAVGTRRIFPCDANGVPNAAGPETGIELLPTDTVKLMTPGGFKLLGLGDITQPIVVDAATGNPVPVPPVGVGNPAVLAAFETIAPPLVLVVAVVAMAYNFKAICNTIETVAGYASTTIIAGASLATVAAGADPKEVTTLVKTIADGTEKQTIAQAALEKARDNQWIKPLLYTVGGIAAIWAIYEILKRIDFGQKKKEGSHEKAPEKAFAANPKKARRPTLQGRRAPRQLAA